VKLPLALVVQLELKVDNTNGIIINGQFYKNGFVTRPLVLAPETRHITVGNLIESDILGQESIDDDMRQHHFKMFYALSAHGPAKNSPVPITSRPRYRGMSGGCPGMHYPP
jgi:hypothetical protein